MTRKNLQVLVTCDRCGLEMTVYNFALPFPHNLDGYLKHKGWTKKQFRDGKPPIDLCPDCQNNPSKPKESKYY